MNPLISIVVPVYKTERYLNRCVESILAQTYQNLEVILVDDGSPDHCPEMCDAFAKKDPRVRVIHKQNGGISDTRNCGIAAATGQLLGFVDSDDYIMPDMYAYLYEGMQRTGADVAICGVADEYVDVKPALPSDIYYISEETVLDRQQAMEAILQDKLIVSHLWDKLFKKVCFRNVTFPLGRRFEDLAATPFALNCAQRVVLLPGKKYIYVHNAASISYTQSMLNSYHIFLAFRDRLAFARKEFPHMEDEMLCKATIAGINLYNGCIKRHALSSQIHLDDVTAFLSQNLRQIRSAATIPLKYKAFSHSIVCAPRLHRLAYVSMTKLLRRTF